MASKNVTKVKFLYFSVYWDISINIALITKGKWILSKILPHGHV